MTRVLPHPLSLGRDRLFTHLQTELGGGAAKRNISSLEPPYGDHSFDPLQPKPADLTQHRAAAVLIGLIDDPDEVQVILTRRASGLRNHAGQIAFPGGKIEPSDDGPVGAALREAQEEIGIHPCFIEPIATLDFYLSGSGFHITPVIARIAAGYKLTPDPLEVAEIFEVPFEFLMTEANHSLETVEWQERKRHFYKIVYRTWTIWGVTAGIIRLLYERLYG